MLQPASKLVVLQILQQTPKLIVLQQVSKLWGGFGLSVSAEHSADTFLVYHLSRVLHVLVTILGWGTIAACSKCCAVPRHQPHTSTIY